MLQKNMSDNSFECLGEIAQELECYDVDENAEDMVWYWT